MKKRKEEPYILFSSPLVDKMKLFISVALICFQAKGILGDEGKLKNLFFYAFGAMIQIIIWRKLFIFNYNFELECFKVFAKDYSGKVATTVSGKACVNWEDVPDNILLQFDLGQWIKDKNFPEKSVKNAKNYCRSPADRFGGLLSRTWCFISNNYESTNINMNEVFEECDVHRCKGKYLILSYFVKYQVREIFRYDLCMIYDSFI